MEDVKRGLEGVLVTESELSHVDGEAGELIYRGYSIEDLAREASFEEVMYLLWHGDVPTRSQLDAFEDRLSGERAIDPEIHRSVAELAAVDERPMCALRTATSMLSAYDDEADPGDPDQILEQGRRLVAKMPTILAAFERARQGKDPISPRADLSHAANFLYMLTGSEPDPVAAETFDEALTLHADHGLNASTFTAIVIGSTLADEYSAVTGGIGALSGSLHGGANQDVMEMLHEIDGSTQGPVEWVRDYRAADNRVPGYGHRVYKVKDPRARILQTQLKQLAEQSGETKWYDYTAAIEEHLADQGLPEKGIAPNVDFYSGSVYTHLGIPTDMFTPIFAMSRCAGWIAHVNEYQSDNRLIRPRARYVGPESREFIPLDER